MIATWPCPLADGAVSDELLVKIGDSDAASILIIPPLFAEHNLMRRQLVLIMRALAEAGMTAHLPDLPGWNESLHPVSDQSLVKWRKAILDAVQYVGATHVCAVRSGALLVPDGLKGWLYAPQSGEKLIRAMVRAQSIADKEAGIADKSDHMAERGRANGIQLIGWEIGPELFRDLEDAEPPKSELLNEISQDDAGGTGLWLRAEPGEDLEQARQIAALIANSIPSPDSETA